MTLRGDADASGSTEDASRYVGVSPPLMSGTTGDISHDGGSGQWFKDEEDEEDDFTIDPSVLGPLVVYSHSSDDDIFTNFEEDDKDSSEDHSDQDEDLTDSEDLDLPPPKRARATPLNRLRGRVARPSRPLVLRTPGQS